MTSSSDWVNGPIGPSLEQAINAWKAAVARYEIRDTTTAENRANRIARSFKFAAVHDSNVAAWSN